MMLVYIVLTHLRITMTNLNVLIHTHIYGHDFQLAKAAYYTSQIDKNKGDSKTLFKLTNSLMGKNGETILPTHSCDKTHADQFLSFFHNKIDNIRTGLCAMVDEPLVEIPDQSFKVMAK